MKHHPDKGGEPREDIVDVFKEVMALDEGCASGPSSPVLERASSSDWEMCMGGCGVPLKAGKWGVCGKCFKMGHKGRTEKCWEGYVFCRGCGTHVGAEKGVCGPCWEKEQALKGSSPSRGSSTPSPPPVSLSPPVDKVGTGRCVSGACVYYPVGFDVVGSDVHGREVEGAFLVDSFSQMVTESGSWDFYMSRMLLDVWQRTGRVFMAVCAGGSAL